MQCFKTFSILLAALWFTASAQAQVYELANLNTEQIRTLDRAKTVVLISPHSRRDFGRAWSLLAVLQRRHFQPGLQPRVG